METLFDLPPLEVTSPNGSLYAAQGAVAELRAIAKLLQLGHKLAKPIIDDDGVDLIVDYRLTVQIKSTSSLPIHFKLARGRRSVGRERKPPASADFFLCTFFPEDAWWVIPLRELGPLNAPISISMPGRGRFDSYREAWHLFQTPST